MQKYKKCLGVLSAYLSYLALRVPMLVHASEGTSDAVSDVMNHDRFQGAIENISFLTNLVDYWFTLVISVTAFFIISSALLKNACAGAYTANHKFWDKVAEAHEKTDALSLAGIKDFFTGKQFMQVTGGGVRDFLLGLVPNIKAMTDFDDADIEPKQYFTKAIPQMMVCVIIGVFIWNGYYRDAAATVGNFGSEICNRVFSSLDPVSFLDKVTQTTKTPENIFAKDTTQQGKDCYALSKALYRSYISISKELTDIDSKTSLMRDCEAMAKDFLSDKNCKRYFYSDSRLYDFSLTNLKTSPCAPSQKTGNVPHIEQADKETQSKFTVVGYMDAPGTAKNYINSATQGAVYITFVMAGSQKEVGSIGLSNVQTAAGTWNNSIASVVTVSVSYNDGVSSHGKVENSSGKSLYTSQVILTKCVSKSSVEEAIRTWCSQNGYNYVANSAVIRSFNNWDYGTAQNPCLKFNKVEAGASKNCEVRASFTVTRNVEEKKEVDGKVVNPETPNEMTLTIPIQVTLTN